MCLLALRPKTKDYPLSNTYNINDFVFEPTSICGSQLTSNDHVDIDQPVFQKNI